MDFNTIEKERLGKYIINKGLHPLDPNGHQIIFRFPNNYGASIVKFFGSFGFYSNLWELAVIEFDDSGCDKWEITYETSISDDVIGHLNELECIDILYKIKSLNRTGA